MIVKTLPDGRRLRKRLKTETHLLDGCEENFGDDAAVLVIPSYLCKGLEFDAVIVSDVSAGAYGECELDITLLYIAMTRALHELAMFAVGAPGPLVAHV